MIALAKKSRPLSFMPSVRSQVDGQPFSGVSPVAFNPKSDRFHLADIRSTSVDFDKRAIDHFPEVEFELGDDLDGHLELPEHAKGLPTEDKLVVAELIVTLHFRHEGRSESPSSVVKDRELFDSGKHRKVELAVR